MNDSFETSKLTASILSCSFIMLTPYLLINGVNADRIAMTKSMILFISSG